MRGDICRSSYVCSRPVGCCCFSIRAGRLRLGSRLARWEALLSRPRPMYMNGMDREQVVKLLERGGGRVLDIEQNDGPFRDIIAFAMRSLAISVMILLASLLLGQQTAPDPGAFDIGATQGTGNAKQGPKPKAGPAPHLANGLPDFGGNGAWYPGFSGNIRRRSGRASRAPTSNWTCLFFRRHWSCSTSA